MTQPTDFDYDVVDPEATDQTAPLYPVAQWHNGQKALKQLGGVAYAGGLVLPVKYLPDGFKIPGWTPTTLTFESGKEEGAFTATKAAIAPIRTRFRWFVKKNGRTTYYPRQAWEEGAGMRGHLQVLVAVKGCDEPLAITFKGHASKVFEIMLKDFQTKVVQAANRNAPKGKPLPRYAFWMSVAAGDFTKVGSDGQDSTVTPPTLALPEEVSLDYVRTLYVGRDNLLRFQGWFRDADLWVSAWDKAGADAPPDEGEPDDGHAPIGTNGAGNGQSLKAMIANLVQPSEAIGLLVNRDGGAVFSECVTRFHIDKQTAADIARGAKGDWTQALQALDQHVF